MVTEFSHKKWDFKISLTHHPNLTLDWLYAFPNEKWSFGNLSLNKNFNLS